MRPTYASLLGAAPIVVPLRSTDNVGTMLLDWLVYGLAIWGLVAVLNATAFKAQPARRSVAWALTVLMFFVTLFALTALQFLRYQVISQDLGFEIRPRSPVDAAGALIFSWLFFSLLRKLPKSSSFRHLGRTDSTGVETSTTSLATNARKIPMSTTASRGTAEIRMTQRDVKPKEIAKWVALSDEAIYGRIADELDTGSQIKGLWLKCFTDANGDLTQQRVLYIKARHSQILEQDALMEEAMARKERERQQQLSYLANRFTVALPLTEAEVKELAAYFEETGRLNERRNDGDTLLHVCAKKSWDHLYFKVPRARRIR